ncbi:arrestin domain-containing protein 3 [Hyalella azteca]|uniref:Arrestin domain-containing protein 3 n=1 Tax=Hyalella azteca TaxID=294128 RepID=A0A8B7NQ82_HYAAZ|nr:arrestin domain-containing protein 3 [Hyalella azteca]
MGVASFTIELRPELPVYFAGQIISGVVKVVTDSPVPCKDLKVKCHGKGKVYWRETRSGFSKNFEDKEEYWEQELAPSSPENARFIRSEAWPATIETGTHEFGFEFILPVEAPSSFESPHSYVRYKVKALAKLPSASDKKAETYFSFCQPYDLNRDRAAREYFALRKELSWGLRPLKHGPVTLDLQSASKASVCGALLQIQASVRNAGHSDVTVKVAMKQRLQYISRSKTKHQTRLVWQTDAFTCPRSSSDARNFEFVIPAVVPHLQYCNIIRMRYVLQIKTSCTLAKSLKIEAPFFLGTIPLLREEHFASSWEPSIPRPRDKFTVTHGSKSLNDQSGKNSDVRGAEGKSGSSGRHSEARGAEGQSGGSGKHSEARGAEGQSGGSGKHSEARGAKGQSGDTGKHSEARDAKGQSGGSGKHLEARGAEGHSGGSGKYLEAGGAGQPSNCGKYLEAYYVKGQSNDSGGYSGDFGLVRHLPNSNNGHSVEVSVGTCFFSSLHTNLHPQRLNTKCPPPNFVILPNLNAIMKL